MRISGLSVCQTDPLPSIPRPLVSPALANYQRTAVLMTNCLSRNILGTTYVSFFTARLFVCSLPINEQCLVPYKELLHQLNWKENPAPPAQRTQYLADDCWQGNPSANKLQVVNVGAFMQDLRGGGGGSSGNYCCWTTLKVANTSEQQISRWTMSTPSFLNCCLSHHIWHCDRQTLDQLSCDWIQTIKHCTYKSFFFFFFLTADVTKSELFCSGSPDARFISINMTENITAFVQSPFVLIINRVTNVEQIQYNDVVTSQGWC